MSETAYTYRSGDGSLRYRVDEYLATQEAYNNILTSKKYADDPEWADTLGHKEDIEQAEKILEQSLSHVTSAIDQNELKQVLSLGLMTEEQAESFSQTKVQMEFKQLTDKSKQSQSSRHFQR